MKNTILEFLDCKAKFNLSSVNVKPRSSKSIIEKRISYELKVIGSSTHITLCLYDINHLSLPLKQKNSICILDEIKRVYLNREPDAKSYDNQNFKDFYYTRIDSWDEENIMVLFCKKISLKCYLLINISSDDEQYSKIIDMGLNILDDIEIKTTIV